MAEELKNNVIDKLCWVWNDLSDSKEIKFIKQVINRLEFPYGDEDDTYWEHCQLITSAEINQINHDCKKLRAENIVLRYEVESKCIMLEEENKRLKKHLDEALEMLNKQNKYNK